MNDLLDPLLDALRETLLGVAPIATVLVVFQVFVLRRRIAQLSRMIAGVGILTLGMVLFLTGLGEALFPLGRLMAEQLTDPAVVGPGSDETAPMWTDYWLVYAFGAAIGFATTIAEPALIAVSMKAHDVSGGTLDARALRVTVAVGVAIGIAVGCLRIVTGTTLAYYIAAGYVVVAFQAFRAPRSIIALAFDTGGVTTSTVTVPLVAALGLGLASTIPGRSPLIDGFGLIAFASLFPMMTVMGYAQISLFRSRRSPRLPLREV